MRKRKIKRYAGEDESLVETSEVEEPQVESRKLDERPDVEGMKRGIAAGTPTDRQTARDIQSFKAAEVKFTSKKPKPKAKPKTASQSFPTRDIEEMRKVEAKTTPKKESGSKGALMAGLGLAAAGAGALAARRSMKEGTRGARIEPTMGSMKSPVRSMTAEEAAWEGEGGRAFRKGGKTKKMASGGSASGRADGIAQRGKTRGRIC